ncbi:MAG TPA: protein-glutamate O-methyltransferase CheR [Gemmatimonadaceae bacterium]|nr:protein-glutamate O-methyltransferase CheR [Gemmatimonadaceae bacterium]
MRQPAAADEPGFIALCRKIERERGFRCSNYKDTCLRRRISVRMRARGAASHAEYAGILDTDRFEYDRLIQTLTINVSKFFRNPETFACITAKVLPELWASRSPLIRIWSAGCATGEEPYSLAVVCREDALAAGEPGRLDRLRILGTDVDDHSVATASRGRYPPAAFVDTAPAVRERYFPLEHGLHTVAPEIRNLVAFEKHDMLSGSAPGGRLHMIVCRNVIIYFTRETQERLFDRFHDLLLPGGFLVLGKVETLLGKSREMFAPVSSRERIFRRL